METVNPWDGLIGAIEPFYPNPQGTGRRPVGIKRMLRIYFLHNGFTCPISPS
ncbi:hypothetical protein [Microbulbifer spongiae]|uniref:Transposase n=1 Tax=Microbulbifer spongiae TaxID=2944933 RepID=A0ABY9EGU5_9GAMM|nr:hypothetical protein [Microbulbifer sp. MI-G]WKD51686.1 hypothetical protein M8T91_18700 [Microbulbifer sp. MI-G]